MKQKDIEAILREELDRLHANLKKMDKTTPVNHFLLYENQYDEKDTIITLIAKILKNVK